MSNKDKSFILLKPDILKNQEALNYMYNQLKINKLKIINEKHIILSYEDIFYVWSQYSSDIIAKRILELYLLDKEVIIFEVIGEGALNKVHRIKKDVRKKYSFSNIQSCLHAPKNVDEYIKDYEYLFNKKKNIFLINSLKSQNQSEKFQKFSLLSEEKLIECGEYIWNEVADKKDYWNKYDINSKKKYEVYLHRIIPNNTIITLSYIAAALLESIENMSIEEAYLLTLATGKLKSCIVFSTNILNEAKNVEKSIKLYGLSADIKYNKEN